MSDVILHGGIVSAGLAGATAREDSAILPAMVGRFIEFAAEDKS